MNRESCKIFIKLITIIVIVSFSLPTSTILAQQAMSSGAYTIQSDSVNFAGVLSSSPSFALEDTLGEIATGNTTSINFSGQIGYQAMLMLVLGDTTPPTAPPSISTTPLTSTRIEVLWGESTDNVAVTRYYIYRDGVRIDDVAIFPRSFVDTGLSPDTLYSYNVSAVDDAGNESLWSATSTARTLLAPVQSGSSSPILFNLSIIPTENSALITFDTTSFVSSVISWGQGGLYSNSLSSNLASNSHRFVIPNLSSGTTYFLKIDLIRQDGTVFILENINFSTLQLPSVIALPNVTNFSALAGENDISLSWRLPPTQSLEKVILVRSLGFYPTSPADGEIIFEGLSSEFVDTEVEAGVRYYYSIFTRDIFGNSSSGAVTSAMIALPGEVVAPPHLPEDVELVGEVDPMIDALGLSDFLFIQSGESIEVRNGVVRIDGSKNLTVALRSYKVPPVLKTIAVTLATQEDEPEYFTFILRINRDGTRYEAVVAPLGETNDYVLKITIIDFKNQGLKKIDGMMFVSSQVAWESINFENQRLFIFGVLILLLLFLFFFIWDRRKKKAVKEERQ